MPAELERLEDMTPEQSKFYNDYLTSFKKNTYCGSDEVKRLIEQKKQETISEIKETMHYVKMIQEETTFVRKQLETIN